MEIITDPTEANATLQHFERAITTDPFCWQDWYVLHIRVEPSLQTMKIDKVASLCKALLAPAEGLVLRMEKDVLGIFQNKEGFNLIAFETALETYMTLDMPQLHLHATPVWGADESLQHDLHTALAATAPLITPAPATTATYHALKELVPHINDLLSAWMTTSKSRSGRTTPHVLLVEDDATTRHIVGHALKNNYPLVTAQNGAEAIEKHLLTAPDIVLLDIGLPDTDGLTLLHWIQQYDRHSRIVMFSGNSYIKNRLSAFAAGAQGFMAKPYNRSQFDHYLSRWSPQPPTAALPAIHGGL